MRRSLEKRFVAHQQSWLPTVIWNRQTHVVTNLCPTFVDRIRRSQYGETMPPSTAFAPEDSSPVARVLRQQVHTAFASAVEAGIPARAFLDLVSNEARPYLEEPIREGYAPSEAGLAAMLEAEGGCVDVATACKLFRRPGGVSRQTLSEKIRAGELIAYRTGGDRWLLPTWQFRVQGGLLKGIPEVLKRWRELSKESDELFLFTFFLQADSSLDGKTPLEALKAGALESVLEALESHPAIAPA